MNRARDITMSIQHQNLSTHAYVAMTLALLAAVAAAACAPLVPAAAPTSSPGATSTPEARGNVVYVKDGDILAWDEATGQSHTVFDAGDVIRVEVSDDGQLVAFLRRSVVQSSEVDFHEQSALWVVDLSGQNPRELVSAESLRELLGASETDSSNIPGLRWIPATHRLLFSGWTYLVQAEGESHAVPRGLVSVDAEDGTQQVLVPPESSLRFVVSPDGREVALLSPTSLGFVGVDGSDFRPEALTVAQAALFGPLFPTGVWTEDSQAFVVTGSIVEDPATGIDFGIWRVPVDGSAPTRLAGVQRSHPASVTFAPDGASAAHIAYTEATPAEIAGWFITPLEGGAGALAIPGDLEVGYSSLHWSSDGKAFTGALAELCPGATHDSDICESPISRGGTAAVQWLDPTHVLLLTRDPSSLLLVSLDPSGQTDPTSIPIATWPLEEFVGQESFAAVDGP
jgi:hypothetical protein